MATRSLCILVMSLLACALLAPADALWLGSHRFMSAASRGVVKPLRSPVLAFQHINSRDYALTTALSWDTLDSVFLTTLLTNAFCVTALIYLFLVTIVDGFGTEFGLGPFLFTNAAMRGDVWTLRLMVHFGQSVNAKAWKGRTALMRATLAGRPAAVRFLLEQGAETYTWGAEGSELDIARRLLAEHTAERSLKVPTDTYKLTPTHSHLHTHTFLAAGASAAPGFQVEAPLRVRGPSAGKHVSTPESWSG